MDLSRVWFEAHGYGATIYVAGFLADPAATRTCELIDSLPSTSRVIRLDLRGVEFIDPKAFVIVARALNVWRDRCRTHVTIEFPARSHRARPHLHLVGRRSPSTALIFGECVAGGAAYQATRIP